MEFNEHNTVLRSFLGMPLGGFTPPIVTPLRRSLDGSTPVLGLPLLALGTSYEKFPGNDYLVNSFTWKICRCKLFFRFNTSYLATNCSVQQLPCQLLDRPDSWKYVQVQFFPDLTQVPWQIAVCNNYPVSSLTDRICGRCASAIFFPELTQVLCKNASTANIFIM